MLEYVSSNKGQQSIRYMLKKLKKVLWVLPMYLAIKKLIFEIDSITLYPFYYGKRDRTA